jgi:hypothetical protein
LTAPRRAIRAPFRDAAHDGPAIFLSEWLRPDGICWSMLDVGHIFCRDNRQAHHSEDEISPRTAPES